MSENYDGDPDNYPTHVRLVQDGEAASEAFLALSDQDNADRTAYLKKRIETVLTSPVDTTLAGIDTTSLDDGTVRNTVDGLYVFRAGATPTGETAANIKPWMVEPATGPGVWFLENTYANASRQIYIPLRPNGLAFGDTSSDMDQATQFGYGAMSDTATFATVWGMQATGFFTLAINDDSGFDGGPGEGSHYGTIIDLTPYLVPYIGLAIFNAELFVIGSASYTSDLPHVMPSFGMRCLLASAESMRSGNTPARDPSASVAEYQASHAIVYTPDQNQRILPDSMIVARIWTDGGNHAVSGTQFLGIRLTIAAQ